MDAPAAPAPAPTKIYPLSVSKRREMLLRRSLLVASRFVASCEKKLKAGTALQQGELAFLRDTIKLLSDLERAELKAKSDAKPKRKGATGNGTPVSLLDPRPDGDEDFDSDDLRDDEEDAA